MMNRFARLAAALSIFLAAFGAAPTQAVAQAFTARAAAVSAASSAAGSAASITAAVPAALSAPALGTLSLSAPSARSLPSAAPSAAAAPLAAAPAVSAAPVAAAAAAAPVRAALAPAAAPAPAAAAAPAAARALREGAARLGESARSEGVSAKSAELDALFTGSVARSAETAGAPALSESRATALAAAAGPRWVFRPETPVPSQPAPRTTLKRSLAIGYLTGLAGLVFTGVATALIAGFTGWTPHGNYQAPFDAMHGGLGVALSIFLGAAVLAPMAEEVIFRGALQGGLSKITARLKLGAFAVPAVITSLAFVAVHETADPVLFAVRLGFAFMLSRVFQKEGILSSMAAHGTFNGLATASIVLAAAHVPLVGQALVLPLALYLAFRAWRVLKAEKPEIAAGTLAPKPFTAKHALLIIPALLAGFLLVMPNLIWLYGMGLLVLWLGGRLVGSVLSNARR
jgi:membrane protease YdiL (CAAX protease family)